MEQQTKSALVARTAVLIDGIRHEISAFTLGKGFSAKWHCGVCGKEGTMPMGSTSVLEAFNRAKSRIYKHYERSHEGGKALM